MEGKTLVKDFSVIFVLIILVRTYLDRLPAYARQVVSLSYNTARNQSMIGYNWTKHDSSGKVCSGNVQDFPLYGQNVLTI